jgi:hypothetical protein
MSSLTQKTELSRLIYWRLKKIVRGGPLYRMEHLRITMTGKYCREELEREWEVYLATARAKILLKADIPLGRVYHHLCHYELGFTLHRTFMYIFLETSSTFTTNTPQNTIPFGMEIKLDPMWTLERITQSDALYRMDAIRGLKNYEESLEWLQYFETVRWKQLIMSYIPWGHVRHHLCCQLDRHLVDDIFNFVYDTSFEPLYLT